MTLSISSPSTGQLRDLPGEEKLPTESKNLTYPRELMVQDVQNNFTFGLAKFKNVEKRYSTGSKIEELNGTGHEVTGKLRVSYGSDLQSFPGSSVLTG